MTQPTPLDSPTASPKQKLISDDLAYILPMGIFLVFTGIGVKWPSTYVVCYLLKTIATAIALVMLWKRYTKVKWNAAWLGLLVGILGIFQWVGMQLWLQRHFAFFAPSVDAFNPYDHFHDRTMLISFIALRMTGAVLVVPFMEELFWRDYLWRQILAPNDFRLAAVGEWSPLAVLLVTGAFCSVHGNCLLTAVGWGLMIALLLAYTKSLGACIIAHATTNLLLGLYVLRYHEWAFW